MEIAKAAILSGLYKTIILDELNPTVDLELLPVESIHQTLLKKPAETEVVITGRCKNEPSYFELADVYSEMVCHKHYANVGVDLKESRLLINLKSFNYIKFLLSFQSHPQLI